MSRVSYVPQRPSLYPGTPLDFLSLVEGFSVNRETIPLPTASRDRLTDQEAQIEAREQNPNGHGWTLIDAKEVFDTSTSKSQMSGESAAALSKSTASEQPMVLPSKQDKFTVQSLGYPMPPDGIGPDPIFFSSAYWNLPSRIWRSDWSQISGGEAQRVGLAIGTAFKIRQEGQGILLLDEPTSALDPQTTHAIERTLLLNPTVLTLIWITHSDDQSKRVTELVAFDNERRIQAGDPDQIGERKVRILRLGENLRAN